MKVINIENIKKRWLFSFILYVVFLVGFSFFYIYESWILAETYLVYAEREYIRIVSCVIGFILEVLLLALEYYFGYKNKSVFLFKIVLFSSIFSLGRHIVNLTSDFHISSLISIFISAYYLFNCYQIYLINKETEQEKYKKMHYLLYIGSFIIILFIIFWRYSHHKVNIQTHQEQEEFQFFSKSEIDYINIAYQAGCDHNTVLLSIADIFRECEEAVKKDDVQVISLLFSQWSRIENILSNPFIDGIFDTSDLNDLRSNIIAYFNSYDLKYSGLESMHKFKNLLNVSEAFFKYVKSYRCNPVRKYLYWEYIKHGSSGCVRFVDSLLKDPDSRVLYKDFYNYDLLIDCLIVCSEYGNVELFQELVNLALEDFLLFYKEENSAKLVQAYINELSYEPENHQKIIEYVSNMYSNKKRYAEILCKCAESMPDFSYVESYKYPEIKDFLRQVESSINIG